MDNVSAMIHLVERCAIVTPLQLVPKSRVATVPEKPEEFVTKSVEFVNATKAILGPLVNAATLAAIATM